MQLALSRSGADVELIGSLQTPNYWPLRLKQIATRIFAGKRYMREISPRVLQSDASQIATRLEGNSSNLVFSPGSRAVAHLDRKEPIVFWTDATFAAMVDFYPSFSNLSQESIRDGNAAEQAALDRCKLAIYSSEWAAESARRHYRVEASKVKVVPFGANVHCGRTVKEITSIVESRPRDSCNLLFVGVEWHRKGGDVAVAIAEALKTGGLPTQLTLLGCEPPKYMQLPECVHVAGFISKTTIEGRAEIERLFRWAHFLILPARADCTPMVVAEANSFGTPAVATNVGGISSIIRDEVNGRTFALEDDISAYCHWIRATIQNPNRYMNMALSSFNEYLTRLNWDVGVKRVIQLLNEVIQR